MHVDLLQTTAKGRGKETHATENGKKTACGINLTKPENIGAYATTGEMSDISQITEITCEKCKTVIAKKLIRENNREMAAMLKEERKREKAAAKHGESSPSYAPSSSDSRGDYVPPSMRRQQAQAKKPIDAPPPAPMKPISMPAPAPQSTHDNSEIPQVPTSIPGVFPSGARPVHQPVQPAAPADDVLAQFAIPTVPTSLPNQTPPLPQQQVQPAAPVDDVLAQFAIPTVPTSLPNQAPPVPQPPVQPAAPVDDVLAQFAIPTVPTSLPNQASPIPQQPVQPAAPVDDVLSQFAIPTVPTSLPNQTPPVPQQPIQPAAPVDDVLSQFAIPTVPTSIPGVLPSVDPAEDLLSQLAPPPTVQQPSALDAIANSLFHLGEDTTEESLTAETGSFTATVQQADEIIEVTPSPAPSGLEPFTKPTSSVSETNDFFVMPGGPSSQDSIPELVIPPVSGAPSEVQLTVPSSVPSVDENSIPTLEIPPLPQAQPYPTGQGYGLPEAQPMPGYPQPDTSAPVSAPSQPETSKLFSVPRKPAPPKPNTPTPLFVGYSADGRQLFQKFDTMGNPIPITEPVYSAPPEQKQPQITPASIMTGDSPVLDIEDLMSEMGIEDPKKKKQDTDSVVHFTEYKKPDPSKKKRSGVPRSAQPAQETGPISAAEAKRRKKLEKINSQFERDLRARGIDPSTGAFIGNK